MRTGPEFTYGVIGAIAGYKALDNLVSLCHTLQNPQIRVAEKVMHSVESVFIVGLAGSAAVFMFSISGITPKLSKTLDQIISYSFCDPGFSYF